MRPLPMLAVPLKETESIDWSTPLRHYIASHYGNWNELTEETQEFNKLRNEMIGCNHDSVGLGFYFKYYSQLELLDMRIPSKEAGGVNVLFTWYDSFHRSTKVSQHSIAFEKASTLFNLGALLSVVADSQYNNHSTEDVEDNTQNFKNALTNYQNAAGVFQFVSDNFLHAPSNDMNQTTVKFLAKLMLAQAQEVFTMNLVVNRPDNANSSLLSKLFQSTANFYGSASELLTSLIKDEIWYGGYTNWLNIVNVKKCYFQALASYHQSLMSSKKSKHGEAIAYMKSALDSLTEVKAIPLLAHSSENDLKQNFVELIKQNTVKEVYEKLKNELASIEKDNDYIYHNSVPQKFGLPVVKSMDAVKPNKLEAQLHDPNSKFKLSKDLFKNIVPLKVHEYNSIYSEEKAKRLRAIEETIDISNESLHSFYDYLHLPKSLIEIKVLLNETNSLSQGSVDMNQEYKDFYKSRLKPLIKYVGEQPEINFNVLVNARNKALDDLKRCEELLKSDENLYNQNKAKYGASWTQQDASLASMDFRNELIKIKRNLVDTEASDLQMESNFAKIEKLYKLLRNAPSAKSDLKAFLLDYANGNAQQQLLIDATDDQESLLDIDDNSINDAKKLVHELENSLNSLNHLKKESELLFADYKTQIHEDDISDILVVNKALSEEQIKNVVFPKELEKFEPYESRIEKIIQKKDQLMSLVKNNFSVLKSNKSVKERQAQFAKRQGKKLKLFEYVNNFEADYKVNSTGLANGQRFYEELANFMNRLELHIRTYINTRNDESSRLTNSLTHGNRSNSLLGDSDNINERLAKLNLSSSSIPTTTTTNNNIYSSDIANQNRYSSISTTTWNQAPLIPKKSSISDPISSPESYYRQLPAPSLPQFPTGSSPSSNLQNLSNLYGTYGSNSNINPSVTGAGAPPPLPPPPMAPVLPPKTHLQSPSEYTSYQQQPQRPQQHQQQQYQDPQQYGGGYQAQQAPQAPSYPQYGTESALPQQPQQTGIPFYNTPSNFNSNMYSMFSDDKK